MALVKYGGGVVYQSGKMAGNIFARNAAGAYVRQWTNPINPSSPAQTDARAYLSAAATSWRTLTPEQRAGWKGYAQGTPLIGRLGEPITVSGISMYVRTNTLRLLAGDTPQLVAPITPGVPPTIEAASGWQLQDSASSTPNRLYNDTQSGVLGAGDELIFIQVSLPVSAGISFYKGPYSGPLAISNGQTAPLSFPLTGSVIGTDEYRFFRVRQMDENGRVSSPSFVGPLKATTA
jgi:hypothetical protein